MSEIKKNIETCRGEDVLAEVSALPQDPHFGSLVNEALDPLKQQALHQAGYDGYSEVIEQHKPYTFASAIIQMKSNLLLLLHMLWQYPFGSGTRSLSDMWSHYITRLSGNETYGIPSRLSDLTDLPSAPLLVADRDMSSGIRFGANPLPDGMSLAQLLCSAYSSVTEIVDDNVGWELNSSISTILNTYFPNVRKLTLGCKNVNQNLFDGVQLSEINIPELEDVLYNRSGDPDRSSCIVLRNNHLIEEFYAPKIKKMGAGISIYGNENLRKIVMPACEEIGGWSYDIPISHCDNLEEVYFDSYTPSKNAALAVVLDGLPSLWKVVAGVVRSLNTWNSASSALVGSSCPKVIHYEIAGAIVSTNISSWNPTYVLEDNPTGTDLIEEGSTATNNLEQFLKNFRTYIALRLADNGYGLTLTLSQAVYDAIKDESHLFVFDEGTMTIYAYLTNIKHWTVTK